MIRELEMWTPVFVNHLLYQGVSLRRLRVKHLLRLTHKVARVRSEDHRHVLVGLPCLDVPVSRGNGRIIGGLRILHCPILLVPDYEVSLEHLLLDLLLLCDGPVHFTISDCTSQHFL